MVISNKTKTVYFDLRKYVSPIHQNIFHHSDCNHTTCSNLNCLTIENTLEFKYLGIIIDSKISWLSHTLNVKSEFGKLIYKFYYLRSKCPTDIKKLLYTSFVESKLLYGISCWGSSYVDNLDPINKAQRKLIRVLYCKRKFSSLTTFLKQANILTVRQLYVYKVLKIFYNRCGSFPVRLDAGYSLRNYNRYLVLQAGKEATRRSFLYMAPYLYSKLPSVIKFSLTTFNFKNKVREWVSKLENIETFF